MIKSLRTPYLATQVLQVVYSAKGVKCEISMIRRGDKEYRKDKEKKKKFLTKVFIFSFHLLKRDLSKKRFQIHPYGRQGGNMSKTPFQAITTR